MKYLSLLLLFLLPNMVYAANCTVTHEHIIAGNLEQVRKVCRENRIELLKATGLVVLRELPEDKYECIISIHSFVIQETRIEENNKLTVIWNLVKGTDRLTHYQSTTTFEFVNENTTKISGKLSIKIGDGLLGSRILEREMRDGITKMLDKLEDKLNGNTTNTRRTFFRFN